MTPAHVLLVSASRRRWDPGLMLRAFPSERPGSGGWKAACGSVTQMVTFALTVSLQEAVSWAR